ncbi:alpha-tocopherol transfer protein-like [Pectinophora gossypiella]|uniref:alpha-tocopherol transfer protein-like n=1 Tax=Pectinophora gossypiella TaxID=13191 RepID=UPI00214F342F|nr:alpha-tocopherol transfer protein-like [Pectinophora gossypiella]
MSLLQGPSAKQAEIIKQELNECEEDLERGVRELRSMCAAAPHLPSPDHFDRQFLELFVRGCRMDMERVRTKFEAFCVARARHSDLYAHRSLTEPPLNDVCKFLDMIPLPRLTDEGYRVTLFRVRSGYPESAADVAAAVRAVLLVSDARMCDERLIAGDVFIWEVSEVRGSLVARVAAAFGPIRRAIQLAQAAYPQRLKRVHVVGAPPFLASSLQLMRSCVNEKVRRRYYLHSKVDELLDHVPARVLPAEWGGQEESIDILTRKWRRRIDELRDYLRDLSELSTDNTPPLKDSDLYGTVGAFRKLDID